MCLQFSRLGVSASDLLSVWKLGSGPIIKCIYELCAKLVNKCNIQSKTPSRMTHTLDNILVAAIKCYIYSIYKICLLYFDNSH
jgi:hypothetical protein